MTALPHRPSNMAKILHLSSYRNCGFHLTLRQTVFGGRVGSICHILGWSLFASDSHICRNRVPSYSRHILHIFVKLLSATVVFFVHLCRSHCFYLSSRIQLLTLTFLKSLHVSSSDTPVGGHSVVQGNSLRPSLNFVRQDGSIPSSCLGWLCSTRFVLHFFPGFCRNCD